MESSTQDFDKFKEMVEKVGIGKILFVTFAYFLGLMLIPLGILSLIEYATAIPITSDAFVIIASVVFIGYFAFDLFSILSNHYTITLAVEIAILVCVLLIVAIFHKGVKLMEVDESTPNKMRESIFPINMMC
jgi:hypothetical protein